MRLLIVLFHTALGILLIGCGLLQSFPTEPDDPAVTPSTAVTTAPDAIETPQAVSPTASATPQSLPVLRIWLPPDIALRTDEGAGLLSAQLDEFGERYPELEILVEQKTGGGQGGILNYLRTGHDVAPSILPDLVALPAELLPEAAAQELILPLNNLLMPEMIDALFPAAARMGVINDELIGYPFALTSVTHLVYNRDVITTTIPLQWSEFVTNTRHTLALPAAGRLSAYWGLEFYLASGGRLLNEAGQPDLQLEPLARALELLSLGRDVMATSVAADTQDEVWQLYQAGIANTVWITSDYYLGLPIAGAENGYMPAPGPAGALTPFTSGWLWLISTPDPAKRPMVAELLTFLVEPQNLGQWSSASNVLPARRDALVTWSGSGSYRTFIAGQLETAEVLPISPNSRVMEALGNAVQEVLATNTSPQLIAEETIALLRQ